MSAELAAMAYRAYHKPLHRYLVRRLIDAEQAQDLAQEAYLRLVRVKGAALVQAPQAYLFRVASNLLSEQRHRERREPVIFDSRVAESALERAEADACELSERIDATRGLGKLLDPLPPLHAAILILRKRDGKSYREIAAELRISEHTVKTYLARAVAQCRLLARGGL